MSTSAIQVSETSAQASARAEREKSGRPSHWVHAKPTEFKNPWPSFRSHTAKDFMELLPKALSQGTTSPSKAAVAEIPLQKPTWGGADPKLVAENAHKIKATWLGHACFLVELPSSTAGVRGARILFDPVFSDRCSPSQWIGPKRFTPPPCALEDVPEIDAIVISHNHYDQSWTPPPSPTSSPAPPAPHVFAPIGNAHYFHSLGIPASRAHCLDWWDARRVTTHVSEKHTASFDITFTPGQHFTGRGILDRFKTLWGGWVVEAVPAAGEDTAQAKQAKVYFGGDTGYRSVPSSTDDGPEDLPVCPAFKEIGERWGSFDFAMIPIGAYAPRKFMSPIHCAPRDSVSIFKDIRARRALGMHWGAWVLTTEDILEPPKLLAKECAKAGVKEGAFGVCGIGETVTFSVGEGEGEGSSA
ncbi:Zn-dependent hydrolase oxidoreductase family [Mycena venus]|uniref:Zn-dependent hydrolase oxidoreductase family n=1 Tax=Mycena venus TaxID=2733690 RepID=A0A8H6YGS8_9AGAR|nr:Zn-dependent hydrolase oxidoreductase family [Mycena venus]